MGTGNIIKNKAKRSTEKKKKKKKIQKKQTNDRNNVVSKKTERGGSGREQKGRERTQFAESIKEQRIAMLWEIAKLLYFEITANASSLAVAAIAAVIIAIFIVTFEWSQNGSLEFRSTQIHNPFGVSISRWISSRVCFIEFLIQSVESSNNAEDMETDGVISAMWQRKHLE